MSPHIAVIIPSYRVKAHVVHVIERIGPEVTGIYVVDDACPERSGEHVAAVCKDPRVKVIFHEQNQGVGGATLTGYAAALNDGAEILVKLDGDGQMDPALIARFTLPIVRGQADYTKGNRFYDLSQLVHMPKMRLLGNAGLSFMAKLSTGYWNLFDINNGFTALHAKAARCLPFDKISKRFFFESDILFRLGTVRAVVVDIPMHAKYGDETSNLSIGKVVGEFLGKHSRNFAKRIFYNYFLRDMTVASLELVFGLGMLLFGLIYGGIHWAEAVSNGVATPLGTIMLAALPTMLGLQLLLAFIGYDVAAVPRRPIHPDLS
jgi:dolichol-phosphate mannosyltransferase